jgi:hypothetical protein
MKKQNLLIMFGFALAIAINILLANLIYAGDLMQLEEDIKEIAIPSIPLQDKAGWNLDNVYNFEKTVDMRYGKIEITNSFLWFLPTDTIETIELKDNTDTCGQYCSATKEITTYTDTKLIDSVKFLKLQDDGKWVDSSIRSYQFYIKSKSTPYEVEDTEYVCTPTGKISVNGTIEQTCENKVTGTHTEYSDEWIPYNFEVMPKGTYTVKLEGEKRPEWTYDWIITSQGRELLEWSVWGAFTSINNLMNYWAMNETGTTSTAIDTMNLGNISWTGGLVYSKGLINNSVTFDDANWGSVTVSNFPNRTYSYWINTSSVTGDNFLISFGTGTDTSQSYLTGDKLSYTVNSVGGTGTTTISIGQWYHIVETVTSTGYCEAYVNGVRDINFTTTPDVGTSMLIGASQNTGLRRQFAGKMDEFALFNKTLSLEEISLLYNSGQGRAYPMFLSNVALNSPANNYISPTNLVTFNATATVIGGATLTNMSLWDNSTGTWKLNQTQTYTGTTNTSIFTNTYTPDKNVLWGIQACDSDGDCGFSENRTVNIDTTNPSITITSPTGNLGIKAIPYNVTLNFSAIDTNLGSCWYHTAYNFTNISIPSCANGSFIIRDSETPNAIYVWANDSIGNRNYNISNFSIYLINSVSYNANVFETATETFTINYSIPSGIASANLNYSGKLYASTTNCTGEICLSTNIIDIPINSNVSINTSSFFWIIQFYNGTSQVSDFSSTYTQNISKINLSYCSGATQNISLNFTGYDEQNLTRFGNIQFDGSFNYWIGSGTSKKQLNITLNASEIDICFGQNTPYYLDAIISYLPNPETGYTKRNYFYQAKRFTQNQTKVGLYSLLSASATGFILKVQDENIQAAANMLVEVQRYYPGTDQTITMFISRTGLLGTTYGDLEANTALYQFLITNNSQTLLTVSPADKVVPQTTPYTLLFQLGGIYSSPFLNILNITNIVSTLYYNSSSKMVVLDYVDTSGNLSAVELRVTASNMSGNVNPVICSNFLYNVSTGQITCNVSTGGGYTATAYYYRSPGRFLDQIVFNVQTISAQLGGYGFLLGFFMLIVCAFMFKFNEIAGIWMTTIAVLFINMLGIINFGYVFVTSTIIIAIIITAILER